MGNNRVQIENLRGPNTSLGIISYRFLNTPVKEITSSIMPTIVIPILLAQSIQKTSEGCSMTVETLYSECIYECMKSCRTSFPTVYRLFTLDNIKKICQSAATNKSSEIAL